jgi:diadenosine tetraphosphate (Ap4A) HIT family hydrolase/5-methylcytosine-specific restriction endonuclease McrA
MLNLKEYIESKMRMSHIYQPVMIKTLLMNKGRADKTKIARSLFSYDASQIEYYEKVTNNMVGRVLRKNGVVQKEKDVYRLNNFDSLASEEVIELIQLCEQKIQDYIDKRGDAIWAHRRKNRKAVSGSVRYEVLKRAKGRCELCGVSKEEKALEVDHILPKNLGGEDSIDNYQSLCYTCNANKRDTDDTDFRELEIHYKVRIKGCVFCQKFSNDYLLESSLAAVILDQYPVTSGHSLVIPKRHCSDYFELSQPELNALHRLAELRKEQLLEHDPSIQGFNLGFNSGEVAGQTVFHCHMHLIPRREGDTPNPRGGIRNVIPGMGEY